MAIAGEAGSTPSAPATRHRWRKGGTCPVPSLQLILLLALSALVCSLLILLHLRGFVLLPSSDPCVLRQQFAQHPFSSPSPSSYAYAGDLRLLPVAWNLLAFSPTPPPPFLLRIALFVKKWPFTSSAGGLERHARTLHRYLADRGHTVHIFTTDGVSSKPVEFEENGLHFHIFVPTASGFFNPNPAWERFLQVNASEPFDIVHSESVALPAHKARLLGDNVVVSWHGIDYEIIQSDIVLDLNRKPDEERSPELKKALSERMFRVVEEIKFFSAYSHHVATSDYVGDVLHTVYQIVPENIHIILNGVDENSFKPNASTGRSFRASHGIPGDVRLVLGAAGRLVRDKGYPLLFEAFEQLVAEHKDVYLMVAGDGPWAKRFESLAPNVVVLGPLHASQLGEFYNAIDIFINPTLRSQGLDHTLLEAMLCGKPLMATHFWSITGSIIINKHMGYTFSPNAASMLSALRHVVQDGQQAWQHIGKMCLQRGSIFTATKMGSSYERLFLCIKDSSQCMYPLQQYTP